MLVTDKASKTNISIHKPKYSYLFRAASRLTRNTLNLGHNMLLWLSILNLVLIIVANPSITNPGPGSRPRSHPSAPPINKLSVAYQNVQGLIPFGSLGNPNPQLNITKMCELQSYVYFNKPDILVLNETWLKPSILDNEILSSSGYNIFRVDRSEKTHPTCHNAPKKFRKNGGGILMAIKADLDVSAKVINVKCSAEILSIQLTFPDGKKLVVCTLYRVGTLGTENFTKIESYLQNILKRRGINNFVLLGDMNLSTINWETLDCTCEIEQNFIDMFDSLGLSQHVKHATHIKGNVLDLVLSTDPSSIINLTNHDTKFICKSDHNLITFDIKAKTNHKNPLPGKFTTLKKPAGVL